MGLSAVLSFLLNQQFIFINNITGNPLKTIKSYETEHINQWLVISC